MTLHRLFSLLITHQTSTWISKCIDCGLLFSTPFDVQIHVKRGCPFQEDKIEAKKLKYDESVYSDKSDEPLDNNNDMDDSAFNPIINVVSKNYTGMNKKWRQLRKNRS